MSDKHSLEFNKIAASILLAGVIAMICGIFADFLYQPTEPAKLGFHVDVAESGGDSGKPEVQVDVGTLLASADAKNGEALVQKKCTSCHDFSQGGPNKVGPNLYGVVGRGIGSKGDFQYSDAVKGHGGNWGYEELNQWLHSPAGFIKGNKMGFAGLKNDKERGDVIAYLKTISPSAPAFPAPKPVAAAPADNGKDNGKGPKANSAKNLDLPTATNQNNLKSAQRNAVDKKANNNVPSNSNAKEIEQSKDVKNPKANLQKDAHTISESGNKATQAIKDESEKAAEHPDSYETESEKNSEE